MACAARRSAAWQGVACGMGVCAHAYVCAHGMCVCVRARARVCMRACVHACMRACVHVCMRACVYACMRACKYAGIYGCGSVQIGMHASMVTQPHACMSYGAPCVEMCAHVGVQPKAAGSAATSAGLLHQNISLFMMLGLRSSRRNISCKKTRWRVEL